MMEPGSRLTAERRDLILERLLASGAVRVAELTEELDVTPHPEHCQSKRRLRSRRTAL